MEEKISPMLHSLFPQLDIIVLDSIQKIRSSLCRPLHNISIVILIVSENELDTFQDLNSIFEQVRVILILADRNTEILEGT